MNANEFEQRLNALIVESVKSMEQNQIRPADIIFALEVQKTQLTGFLIMRAQAQAAANGSPIIIPRVRPPDIAP